MRYFGVLSIIVLAAIFSGCNHASDEKALDPVPAGANKISSVPMVKFVDSPQLAEIILKPERKVLGSNRDPFAPLLAEEMPMSADGGATSGQLGGNTQGDLAFMGVIRLGDDYFAYLKTGTKTGVYKVLDKIGNYTIQHIDTEQIVLKSGDNEIVKKRGKI